MEEDNEAVVTKAAKKEMAKAAKKLKLAAKCVEKTSKLAAKQTESVIARVCTHVAKLAIKRARNRGYGAGGANTNASGLPYEALTDLTTHFTEVRTNKSDKLYKEIHFNRYPDIIYICSSKAKFLKLMEEKGFLDATVPRGHGNKWPDECYLNIAKSIVYILEKKFQLKSGSVCEKIQTAPFKLHNYKRLFPKLKVVYMYCLSDWFKTNCVAELEYLALHDIPVFWGSDFNYKEKVIRFITQTSLNHAKT